MIEAAEQHAEEIDVPSVIMVSNTERNLIASIGWRVVAKHQHLQKQSVDSEASTSQREYQRLREHVTGYNVVVLTNSIGRAAKTTG